MNSKENNINFITGFKGWLALLVVIHHFGLVFFPSLVNGDGRYLFISKKMTKTIIQSPFNFIGYGGALAVSFFFIISGYLIAKKSYNKSIDISNKMLDRYKKLVRPVLYSSLFALVLVTICKKIDLFWNPWLSSFSYYKNVEPNIILCLYQSFVDTFATGAATFNPPLWTMSAELLGSLFLYILFHIFKNNEKFYHILFIILLIFLRTNISYFIFGVFVEKFEREGYFSIIKNNVIIKLILLILCIYLFGFTYLSCSTNTYVILNKLFTYKYTIIDSVTLVRYISSVLFFILLINSKVLIRIFSFKISYLLGKISLPLYLLHWPILYTLIIYITYKFNGFINNKTIVIFSSLLLFVLICIIISIVYNIVSKKLDSIISSKSVISILDAFKSN